MKIQTLEYNKQTAQITLNTYDDGFLLFETDITAQILTLALEKLYDDYGLGHDMEGQIWGGQYEGVRNFLRNKS